MYRRDTTLQRRVAGLLLPFALLFLLMFTTPFVLAGSQDARLDDQPEQLPSGQLTSEQLPSGQAGVQQFVTEKGPSVNIRQVHPTEGLGRETGVFLSDAVPVPIDRPDPFLAVAGSWLADDEVPGLVDFDIRFSRDGESWSEWLHAGYDHDGEIDDGLHHGELVFTGKETRFVRYRVRLKEDPAGHLPVISEVTLHFISPGSSGPELREIIESKSYQNRTRGISGSAASPQNGESRLLKSAGESDDQIQSSGSYPLPAYVDRETWSDHLDLTNTASRTPTNVSHLVVHHSAGQTNASDFAAVVRSYWNHHTHGRNWGDIGYHWLVDPNGVVYQGRAFNLDGNKNVMGTHAGGFNTNSMGICVIGDYTNIRPADDALASMYEVLAWKADERGIDPMGTSLHSPTMTNRRNILGHRDVTSTQCPGNTFYPMLPEVRRQVALLVESWIDPGEIVVEQNWERSFDSENAFEWMGSGASETELSLDYHDGLVYVAGNSNGPKIQILDADDGSQSGVIDIENVLLEAPLGKAEKWDETLSTVFFAATVRVTDDGYLVVSNRTVNAATSQFLILIIDPNGDPSLLDMISFNEEPWRLGDQLSVSGSISDNTVDLYAPVSVEGKAIRWREFPRAATSPGETLAMTGQPNPEILDLSGMQEWGRQAAIAPKTRGDHRGFFAGALRSDLIREYDEDGNPVGFVSFGDGENHLSALHHASYQGREFLFAFHPESRQVRAHTLFGEPGDAETNRTAYHVFLSESLGSTSNRTTINIGDMAVRDNRNGSFDVFVLAPNNGIWSFYMEGPDYDGLVSADDELAVLPESYTLKQNYPNPFNPVTQIRYELPESAQVRLEVYSITGQRVMSLVNERQSAGAHQVTFDATGLASGIYIYRIQAGSYVSSRQMTLIR